MVKITYFYFNILTKLTLYFFTGEEAKNIWLKVRGSYRDARRRQQKLLKSGSATQDIKLWKYQKQMSFLEPFMSTGPRESNINETDEDSQLSSDLLRTERLESQDEESVLAENEEFTEVDPNENVAVNAQTNEIDLDNETARKTESTPDFEYKTRFEEKGKEK